MQKTPSKRQSPCQVQAVMKTWPLTRPKNGPSLPTSQHLRNTTGVRSTLKRRMKRLFQRNPKTCSLPWAVFPPPTELRVPSWLPLQKRQNRWGLSQWSNERGQAHRLSTLRWTCLIRDAEITTEFWEVFWHVRAVPLCGGIEGGTEQQQ